MVGGVQGVIIRSVCTAGRPATRPWPIRYSVAVATVLLGWIAREFFTSALGPGVPFIFFFPAVAVAAWYGGVGPAILATVLAELIADWFLFEPVNSLAVNEWLSLVAFAVSAGFIIAIIQAMHLASAQVPSRSDAEAPHPGRNVIGVFVVMAIVTMSSVLVIYWFGLRVIALRDRAAPHRKAIAEANALLSTLKDAETAQRGFIITGDERYLTPYNAALVELPVELSNLRSSNVGIPTAQLEEVDRLVREKLNELEQTIALRRGEGFEAAMKVVRSGQGKETMDQLRQRVGAVQRDQDQALLSEAKAADNATYVRTTAAATVTFFNLLFLWWAYQRITAAIRQRQTALIEVEQQKDLLSVTLASIGDCVIVTDAAGRITFMNNVAEELTGWNFADANLRPAADVFKIINELSREPVESPVEKVMKQGVIVGLANHTLLIRKDGSEVPIDDSGAPIREANGGIRGVVLVFRDFSQHKEAARKLEQAKESAEQANKVKDRFLAMLSHELRTPLTPVLATLNLWETNEDLPSEMLADVQMMRRSVELEAKIIDDLLDLTRVARGRLVFSEEDIDVHQLVRSLIEMFRTEFRGKQLNLLTDLNATQRCVRTDAARLQQILWNIINNAVKFTGSGGTISVSTANGLNENIEISITDTGIGMAPHTLMKLFSAFEQADEQVGRRYGGLGLGLAISSALVERMNGTISARSDGIGKGSTFLITLPVVEDVDVQEKHTATGVQKRSEKAIKILLVEDHKDTLRALFRLLERQGHSVRTEENVASALKALGEENFHLLMFDIGLPDGTGFELIREVRKKYQTPALALSGFGTKEDVARSKEAGFNAHLVKPVNFQKLEAVIGQLIADGETACTPGIG